MDIITGNVGWIEVICGPMFSGKSEELIRRLRRAMIARKRVEVFKPRLRETSTGVRLGSQDTNRQTHPVKSGVVWAPPDPFMRHCGNGCH